MPGAHTNTPSTLTFPLQPLGVLCPRKGRRTEYKANDAFSRSLFCAYSLHVPPIPPFFNFLHSHFPNFVSWTTFGGHIRGRLPN